jgi:hypothetical protein
MSYADSTNASGAADVLIETLTARTGSAATTSRLSVIAGVVQSTRCHADGCGYIANVFYD